MFRTFCSFNKLRQASITITTFSTDNEKNLPTRWFALSSTLILAIFSGSGYAFGILSPELKSSLHYDQASINLISGIASIGLFLGLLPGFCFKWFGARWTLFIGSLFSVGALTIIWLFFGKYLESSVASMSTALFFSYLGNSFRLTVVTGIGVLAFSQKNRGKILGLIKGFFALGASVFSLLSLSIFKNNIGGYLFCIDTIILITSALSIPYMRVGSLETQTSKSTFNFWYYFALATAAFIIGLSIVEHFLPLPFWLVQFGSYAMLLLLIGLWFLPLLARKFFENEIPWTPRDINLDDPDECPVIYKSTRTTTAQETTTQNIDHDWEKISPCSYTSDGESKPNCAFGLSNYCVDNMQVTPSPMRASLSQRNPDKCGNCNPTTNGAEHLTTLNRCNCVPYELSLLQAMKTVSFYVIFAVFFFASGGGLVVIHNIHAIQYSITQSKDAASYVSILGISNFVGRILYGYLSDRLYTRAPRYIFLFISTSGVAISHFLLSLGYPFLLLPSIGLAAISYGGSCCIVPSLVADMYGSKNFVIIYGLVNFAPAAGGYFLSSYIFRMFYKSVNLDDPMMECVGVSCFQKSFVVIGICCSCVAFLALFTLSKPTRTLK